MNIRFEKTTEEERLDFYDELSEYISWSHELFEYVVEEKFELWEHIVVGELDCPYDYFDDNNDPSGWRYNRVNDISIEWILNYLIDYIYVYGDIPYCSGKLDTDLNMLGFMVEESGIDLEIITNLYTKTHPIAVRNKKIVDLLDF